MRGEEISHLSHTRITGQYLEEKKIDIFTFSRFGCLCRASAVLLYNYEHIEGFLYTNPYISNKLACPVRELLNLPHLKVILDVFALLGVYLIESLYCKTIGKTATHSKLKVFYKELHTGLIDLKG